MVKHRKKVCTSSVKITGGRMTVKAACPVKGKGKVPCAKPSKVKRTKHTEVPASCKGLKKKARRVCAKNVCNQRQEPYRTQCKKAAGLR